MTVVTGVDHNFGSQEAQARVTEALQDLLRAVRRAHATRVTAAAAAPRGELTLAGRT